MTLLKGKQIGLRALEPEDLDFLYQLENNPETWQVSSTYAPYSKYVLRQYLESSQYDIYTSKQLRLVIFQINKPQVQIGAIDLFDFDPFHLRAGVGVIVQSEKDRRKGYAKEALQLLAEYSFSFLKLKQLFCTITENNMASIKLFEESGFEKCGLRKDWIKAPDGWKDEIMYQKINLNI
jgi:diamine N-acetyltransferase